MITTINVECLFSSHAESLGQTNYHLRSNTIFISIELLVKVCGEEHRDALVHRRPHVIIEISKVYPYIIYGMGLLPIYLVKVRLLWSKLLIKGMVAYFCHHLSDNQIFMLTCQLFMSTCQIIMSTCQILTDKSMTVSGIKTDGGIFLHHLSDYYVDLSVIYVYLSDHYVYL